MISLIQFREELLQESETRPFAKKGAWLVTAQMPWGSGRVVAE